MQTELEPSKASDVEVLCQEIRDHINAPRKQQILMKNHNLWLQLCSSLDVIGDAEYAFSSYLAKEFKNTTGAHYLTVYGLFQALVIQQDAVVNLCESLAIPLKEADYPRLQEIRELRHKCIGHPTKVRGRKGQPDSYHYISRPTLGFEGFTLLSSDGAGKDQFQHVSTLALIADQSSDIATILRKVFEQLEQQDQAHREQFRMEKLAAIFPETMHYYMGKVFEGIDRLNYAEMGAIHLELIQQIFEDFQAALERRGLEMDTYDSVKYLYEEIAYPLSELRIFFERVKNGEEPVLRPEAASIFVWFLNSKLDELRRIAQEIDEDYAS